MLTGIIEANNSKYRFTYDANGNNERLDIYGVNQEYSPAATTGINSFIKTSFVAYLGDKTLIDSVLELLHLSYSAESRNVIDGSVVVSLSSKDGQRNEFIDLATGKLSKVTIQSTKMNINAVSNEYSSTLNITPININDYVMVGERKVVVDMSGSVIRSYEYLKAENPYIAVLEKRDYVVVKSMDDFYSRFDEIVHNKEQLVGLDIETTGLGVDYMRNDEITGVILSNKFNVSTYYPFRQPKFKFNLDLKYLKQIFDVINNQPKDTLVCAHNGVMERKGFYKEFHKMIRIDADTMTLSVMIDPMFNKAHPHDLKSIEEQIDRLLIDKVYKDKIPLTQLQQLKESVRYLELKDIFIDKKHIDFSQMTEDITKVYACPDGDGTIKAYDFLINKLPKDEINLFKKIESPVQEVKTQNEYYGLKLDIDRLVEYKGKVERQKNFLEELFHRSVDDKRSITASSSLIDIIYRKLNAPVLVVTAKDGKPATNKNAIVQILKNGEIREPNPNIKDIVFEGETLISKNDLNNKYYPLVILQKFNLLQRQFTTVERMLKLQVNGRIPFYCKAIGASSERQASDAQQYGPQQKGCVGPDSEDHYFFSIDYMQIELRILASEAGEQSVIEKFNDPDADGHRIFASNLSRQEMYLISSEDRSKAKSMNFGIVYGKGDYSLAKDIFKTPRPTDEQVNEARNYKTAFFNSLPAIKRYIQSNKQYIQDEGEIKTHFGWHRYAKEILDPDTPEWRVASIIRQLNNTPIQGYGAALLKLVECRMNAWIKERGWDTLVDCHGEMLPMVRMMLPIHDEILVSAHKSIPLEELLEMFRGCFEIDIKGACKYYAAPSMAPNWLSAHDEKAYEIPIKLRDKLIDEYHKTGVSKINGDNWTEMIADFRSNEIKSWFTELVKNSKNFDELWQNVKHPTLTHELIALECDKPENKAFPQHIDKIKISAYKYLLGMTRKQPCTEINYSIDLSIFGKDIDKSWIEVTKEEEVKQHDDEDLFTLDTDVVNFDEEGNIVENEDEDNVYLQDEESKTESSKSNIKYKPVICMDQVFINDTDITENIDEFVKKLKEFNNDKANYKVYIVTREGAKYICTMDYDNVLKIGGQ